MTDIKISIIIPIYNVEPYILRCLQSVIAQTMTDGIECILVDDCGKDDSVLIAERFIQTYHGHIKFSLLHRECNGGLSAARNTGIQAAVGEYLYFLDSDDEIKPQTMELMWSYIRKYGKVDLVQGSFYENEEEKKSFSKYRIPEYTNDKRLIKPFLLQFEGDIVGAQSRLVRKDFLLSHNLYFKEGIIHEDNYWTFFLSKYVETMAFCNVPTYFHRYNPNSITGNINVNKESFAFKIIIEDFSANIDSFLPGSQKELILSTLLYAINNHYYTTEEEKQSLIEYFLSKNSITEKIIFRIIINLQNKYLKNKIRHLLIRLYKWKD